MNARRNPRPEPDSPGGIPSRTGAGGAADPVGADGGGLVDFHNHLLPGVDDGAADAAESCAALSAMRAEGVTALVVTPHFEAGLLLRPAESASRLEAIDAAWAVFQPLAADAGMHVRRGVELRLDLALPDASDARLRLGGGPFVLCEFPFFTVPPRSDRVLAALRQAGWYPIVAHPERYEDFEADHDVVERWLDAGGFLQVNGASLLGRYGDTARRTAATLLGRGVVQYVSSDWHARGAPRIREYVEALAGLVGAEATERLTRVNPGRLLRGELPLPLAGTATDVPPGGGAARA